MEDNDDEFGDLYSDVLPPFSSSSPPPPISPSPAANSSPPTIALQPQPPQQQTHSSDADFNPPKEPDVNFIDNDVKFDIEEEDDENNGIPHVIPGLFGDAATDVVVAEDDDWDDSDSEDDLQIVLNDNNALMAMEMGGMMMVDGSGNEDAAAAGDPNNQAAAGAEEQEWGENASSQPIDGERKDHHVAESSSKASGFPLKIGFGHQGYHHPFHSQFKYVRPGATPMPGATTSASGGPPGLIRPLANMIPMAGRGRGEWRPAVIKSAAALQKGFHAGRGFGGGLEFTLPSHKTIFDVDINSFEEKPWKYPGVDVSVFFNFDLNEDSWKDYCKQLEQLRLESTMQSKIRVYESGRREQDYDPDLPPELAAATGIHDDPVENANPVKSDVRQSDLITGSGRVRPLMPPGRAIQVESGYGERLPSIDTRLPRNRDSDAIIEIVLQDTPDDDSSAGIDVQDQPENGEPQKEDFPEDGHAVGDKTPRLEPEYFDGLPQDYKGQKRELARRSMPFMNSDPAHVPDEDENLPFPQEEPIDGSDSTRRSPRRIQGRVRGRSPHITPSRQMAIDDNQKKESVERMEGRCSAVLKSAVIKDVRDSSVENDAELEETGAADGSSRLEEEDINLNTVSKRDTHEDVVAERKKLTSLVEHPLLDEGDGCEDSKAARSSDNSKARSASSRDHQKQQESFEEEVVEDSRSVHLVSIRRQPDDNKQVFHRRDLDRRQEPDRDHMTIKNREEPYPYKDQRPSSAHQLHTKIDGFDRKKDRDSSDMDWTQRENDLISRKVRNDEPRKRGRGKVRENERNDKDDDLHSRKELDNGSVRVPFDKESRVLRHRERGDGLKGKHEAVEDFYSKRRKDEEYLRREHIDKEEILHGYRQNASRHGRERDEADQRKRDDHQRSREIFDDQYASRQKDEAWLLRERGGRQRDREEWHRGKQSHEEQPSKREIGRNSVRSGRGAEEKTWVGHVRAKDEHKVSEKDYQYREAMQHRDQLKRRNQIQGESPDHKGHDDDYALGNQYSREERSPPHKGRGNTYVRGNQYNSEERLSRQERSSSHSGRVANASDNQRVHERKHKEGSSKSKDPAVGTLSLGVSKRSQEDRGVGQINEKVVKGTGDEKHAEQEIPGHRLSRRHQEDIPTDDEQQDSQRGRSKLERWTRHKERDFSTGSKSSSSLKLTDTDKDNNEGSSEAGKTMHEYANIGDADNRLLVSVEGKDSMDMDQHIDTVEKLKKRSERFKLPMPGEKEALVIKKLESEALPSAKTENPVDSEVKQERPARKRRWKTN
ncbi:hypothetical protein RIF29_07554 [Crotalaria pallida]|uniref:Pre-mRNA polyadenylation factor Fip1 domain-containing protein n=1 Tax=Crotalaria pallida TaxID=3830 RepID=A0AAN9J724_CROPI